MRFLAALAAPLVASVALAAAPDHTLTLLDAGVTRRYYEYAPEAGSDESVEVRVELDQKVAAGVVEREIIFPAVIARVDLTTDPAPLADAIGASVSVEAVRVETREGVPAEIMPALEKAIGGFRPVAGRFEAARDGELEDFTLVVESGLPPVLSQSATQISGALQSLLVPLPETPIGVGAKWSVASEIVQPQYVINQTTTYTLDRVDGRRLAVSVEIEQDLPENTRVRDASGQWEGSIIEFYGEGGGTIIVSLNQLSPLHSDIAMGSRVIIEAESEGEKAQSGMASTTRALVKGEIIK